MGLLVARERLLPGHSNLDAEVLGANEPAALLERIGVDETALHRLVLCQREEIALHLLEVRRGDRGEGPYPHRHVAEDELTVDRDRMRAGADRLGVDRHRLPHGRPETTIALEEREVLVTDVRRCDPELVGDAIRSSPVRPTPIVGTLRPMPSVCRVNDTTRGATPGSCSSTTSIGFSSSGETSTGSTRRQTFFDALAVIPGTSESRYASISSGDFDSIAASCSIRFT